VDDYVEIGSKRELEAIAKGVDAKYDITSLGEVKWVLGMLLERECSARTMSILQEAFIDSTTILTPLAPGTQLSAADCPTSKDKLAEVSMRPYRELVEALAWLALGGEQEEKRKKCHATESDKESHSEESDDDNASTDANKNKNGKGDSGYGSDKDDSPYASLDRQSH
jgi:hypothetical protein